MSAATQDAATQKHSINPYIISTTSPEHISNIESDFVSITPIINNNPNNSNVTTADQFQLRSIDGSPIVATGKGDVHLILASGNALILKNALYAPTSPVGIISFSRLVKDMEAISTSVKVGMEFEGEGARIVHMHSGRVIATGSTHPVYGLPALDLRNPVDISSTPLQYYAFSPLTEDDLKKIRRLLRFK